MITITSQKDSYTKFDVNGIPVQAWCIVGGSIGVAFQDFSFTERLGTKKGYTSGALNQNPEISDLKNGEQTLFDFVARNLPKKELRTKRYNELISILGGSKLVSRRFHDKFDRCYFKCELEISSQRISPVTVSSAVYGGRCECVIKEYADKRWNTLLNYFNPLFDSGILYETLTEEQFTEMKEVLLNHLCWEWEKSKGRKIK
jgi:hypothetical protein